MAQITSYDRAKIWRIQLLMSMGYNMTEIAGKIGVHRCTVSRYKKEIRRMYG